MRVSESVNNQILDSQIIQALIKPHGSLVSLYLNKNSYVIINPAHVNKVYFIAGLKYKILFASILERQGSKTSTISNNCVNKVILEARDNAEKKNVSPMSKSPSIMNRQIFIPQTIIPHFLNRADSINKLAGPH